MTKLRRILLVASLGIGVSMMSVLTSPADIAVAADTTGATSELPLAHTHEVFKFVANGTIDLVFPLFGADKERLWAPEWNPAFVWPAKAVDQQGMVFKVAHGDRTAIWVNTLLDPSANAVQYVYVIPDVVVTVINLSLTPSKASTEVTVSYDRTALAAGANALVKKMAEQDRNAGPEWGQQINAFLKAPR